MVARQKGEMEVPNRQKDYELESLLREVDDHGFVVIYITKIWRLLDKWSRAAGTWKALLDAWEEMDSKHKRADLHILEVSHEFIVITRTASAPMIQWAGESA